MKYAIAIMVILNFVVWFAPLPKAQSQAKSLDVNAIAGDLERFYSESLDGQSELLAIDANLQKVGLTMREIVSPEFVKNGLTLSHLRAANHFLNLSIQSKTKSAQRVILGLAINELRAAGQESEAEAFEEILKKGETQAIL